MLLSFKEDFEANCKYIVLVSQYADGFQKGPGLVHKY